MTDPITIYQIKVTLREIESPVWRRFQVQSYKNLHELHLTLQAVMGWTDSHLYAFTRGDLYYGIREDLEYLEAKDARTVRLDEVVHGQGARIAYEYDFGDYWLHTLVLEEILETEPGRKYPFCLDGSRACPPEDCGGTSGYERLLEALRDPRHEDHIDMWLWAGEDFDPEAFDVDRVNRKLRQTRERVRFTQRQGQYLAYIHHFTQNNGHPPSTADMQRHFNVSRSTVSNTMTAMEMQGSIDRILYQPGTVRVLVPPEELPHLE